MHFCWLLSFLFLFTAASVYVGVFLPTGATSSQPSVYQDDKNYVLSLALIPSSSILNPALKHLTMLVTYQTKSVRYDYGDNDDDTNDEDELKDLSREGSN